MMKKGKSDIKGARKKELKRSLFIDYMIGYVKNPKALRKHHWVFCIMCQYRNVAVQKVNMQKSMVFLYKRNEQLDIENLKILKFVIRPKRSWDTQGQIY